MLEPDMNVKEPSKESIDALRKSMTSGVIDPNKIYTLDVGNGIEMPYTGAELLETARCAIGLYDAKKSGDGDAMISAARKVMKDMCK